MIVRFETSTTRILIEEYRRAASSMHSIEAQLNPLILEAKALLNEGSSWITTTANLPSIELREDASDLEWRLDYIEANDILGIVPRSIHRGLVNVAWREEDARAFTYMELLAFASELGSTEELLAFTDWLVLDGGFDRFGLHGEVLTIPEHLRPIFAQLIITAIEKGWSAEGRIPMQVGVGVAQYGEPSDELLLRIANDALDDFYGLGAIAELANPFGVDSTHGAFPVVADALVQRPEATKLFVEGLLDEYDDTGSTRLNTDAVDATTESLAQLLITAGTFGEQGERQRFVNRIVHTMNADGATNERVFMAAWSLHAGLAFEGVATSTPTFDTHHLMPDFIRPTWASLWNRVIAPSTLAGAAIAGEGLVTAATIATAYYNDPSLFLPWNGLEEEGPPPGPGNDAGGTYSTREKFDFYGGRLNFTNAELGRNAIAHALRDGSDRGDISQDEFAIIDHGIGANGKPTYTINLPGVTDLSKPHQGWDDWHQTVRDMDMAAEASSHSTSIDDNLYAQMVERALRVNEIPAGSNLMIVGHSFGADTAADLASDKEFIEKYNLTHIVAAGYDSEPQLAHISPDVEVLVLQNNQDLAIKMEALGRRASSPSPEVSVDTFAHDVHKFDSGFSKVGHHQDHYIDYLYDADDAELTTFFESVTKVGYGDRGKQFAVDVTLDESLIQL